MDIFERKTLHFDESFVPVRADVKARQLIEDVIKLRNRNIEDALAEYFTHKYNIAVEVKNS